jgi:hypothetical protein
MAAAELFLALAAEMQGGAVLPLKALLTPD